MYICFKVRLQKKVIQKPDHSQCIQKSLKLEKELSDSKKEVRKYK